MTEYKHHELSGLQKVFRNLAYKIYPNKKWMFITIIVSFCLACVSLLIQEKIVNIPVGNNFPIFFISIAVWMVFLIVLCNNFYPNQTYTDDNYVLSSYEMASNFMKTYTITFNCIGFAISSVITLALVISICKDVIKFTR